MEQFCTELSVETAIRRFEDLYTGAQRNDSRLWMDYFTSGVFLDAAWDRRFTARMLETVTKAEPDLKPGREFIQWLSIAYQISAVRTEDGALCPCVSREGQFDGQEAVLKIVLKGPVPKRPRQNGLAILNSFLDYRRLVGLAERGSWDVQAMETFQWIVDRYSSAYIKERCEQRANPEYERHPAGLRVFIHFFRRRDLPEEVYRTVWERFDLKSAVMGRSKVLYGPLREIVAERVPGIDGEKQENFFQLNLDRDACYGRIRANPEREGEETAALFAGAAVQKALRSRRFVEEQLLSYGGWMNVATPEGVVRRLMDFYRAHPEIPGWDRVVERGEETLKDREKVLRGAEAAPSKEASCSGAPDLSLLEELPLQIFVQSGTGPETAYRHAALPGEEVPPEEELTDELLAEMLDRFAREELDRLEICFYAGTLVLARSGDSYACFYFQRCCSTWYAMLSQPEVYMTVDCGDVVYEPFGMGLLAGYNVHRSAASVMSRLNLVFMQISRGSLRVRTEDCWLWSTCTSLQNGEYKKRMAMQKLAGIPASRAGGYILGKFVFSRYPAECESVTLAGERTGNSLGPGTYGLASNALVQFVQRKLARLRLSWEFKNPEGGAYRRHIVLLQDGGRFMLAWLRDDMERADLYASDVPRAFLGRVYSACPVHLELARIRNCLDLLLDDIANADLVTDRPGEFVPADRPYARVRAEWVDGRIG